MNYALAEIGTTADKHGAFATDIQHGLIYFTEVAAALAKYADGESIEDVEAAYKDELMQKAKLSSSRLALRHMVEQMSSGRLGAANLDNVADMYKDKVTELNRQEVRKIDRSEEMTEFKRAVWEAGHPDEPFMLGGDDDLAVMTTGEDNFICPLTRMELVEPMRNVCGHVYSKEAVLAYLKSRQGACPVAGCMQRVSAKSLTPDEALTRKMETSKKRKRTEPQKEVEDL